MLQTHGPYIQSAANMSLQESLRSILRALTVHEKDIFKVSTENMFTVNFILSQLDESRDDALNVDESEGQESEVELGDGEVVEGGEEEIAGGDWSTDATSWSTAWEDSEEVSNQQVQDIISSAVSHFTGGAMDIVPEEESKDATASTSKKGAKAKKGKESKSQQPAAASDGSDSDGKSKKSRRVSFSKKLEAVKIIS